MGDFPLSVPLVPVSKLCRGPLRLVVKTCPKRPSNVAYSNSNSFGETFQRFRGQALCYLSMHVITHDIPQKRYFLPLVRPDADGIKVPVSLRKTTTMNNLKE